ncbi:DUF2946 family protein [Rhodoferax antarcticus]|uniref:DUF2946 domain-containing protein n=1 Tax=Rhodoferax antarcticus ANT.BR TaxID=1111071 RepID=A0A1Q8YDE1_9BURK|nr:hypothetical protein [Rhodoferax antarcticus]APW45910.1 hypothetical protein RA876_05490 [Rhodoferax antarcticus]OLP06023.1 hypothetical protein BLL52_2253 [Rhodoferax antarcticus ANT.BR]
MLTSHTLRQFTRWVALWFVLSLGAAVASPLINPQAMSLICSSAGAMKVIVQTDDGAVELGSRGLDCPLCANLGAPPPQIILLAQLTQQAPGAPQPSLTAQPSSQPHEPWQARAPPVFS